MNTEISRRDFLRISAGGLALGTMNRIGLAAFDRRDFKLSLNESSLHHSLTKKKIDHLDLARIAKKEFEIDAIEYVSSYFREKVNEEGYIKQMNRRAAEYGVRQILIVIDDAVSLADADAQKRKAAVKQHEPWVDAAKSLGCHSVCVKITGEGPLEDRLERCKESLNELADYAKKQHIHVLICGGSDTQWSPAPLVKLLRDIDSRNVGAYPSFQNIAKADAGTLEQLIPLSKGIRATAEDFDDGGNETMLDFFQLTKTILDAGYRGHVSINYRGEKLDEAHGIRATKALLDRVLSAEKMAQS